MCIPRRCTWLGFGSHATVTVRQWLIYFEHLYCIYKEHYCNLQTVPAYQVQITVGYGQMGCEAWVCDCFSWDHTSILDPKDTSVLHHSMPSIENSCAQLVLYRLVYKIFIDIYLFGQCNTTICNANHQVLWNLCLLCCPTCQVKLGMDFLESSAAVAHVWHIWTTIWTWV